jgi:hypothetical protein
MHVGARKLKEDAPEASTDSSKPVLEGKGKCLSLPFATFADCGDDFLSAPTQIKSLNIQRRPGTLGWPKHEFLAISSTNQDRSFRPSFVQDCCKPPPGHRIDVDLHFS